jgi:hypothetical protein
MSFNDERERQALINRILTRVHSPVQGIPSLREIDEGYNARIRYQLEVQAPQIQ